MNNLAQFPELDFCVTFFQIVTPDNRALSPRFESYEQAVDRLGSILYVSAVISEQTVYFSEANEFGRCELLSEIKKAGGAS